MEFAPVVEVAFAEGTEVPRYIERFEETPLGLPIVGTWTRTNTTAATGTWCLRSAVVGHNEYSAASLTAPQGTTKFYFAYKVSSEATFDWFRVHVDGVQVLEASGEVGWTTSPLIDVNPGSTIMFYYIKDGATSSGDDAAYIDNLTFYGPERVWTDITPWVRIDDGIRIVRGRGDEQSEARPGTLAFTLDNRDGRFTPSHPGSPYHPNVRKGVPIRCTVAAVAKNYVTNSSFETSTSDWRPIGSTPPDIYRQPNWFPSNAAGSGSTSLNITWRGGLSPGVETTVYGLTPGERYTASAYVHLLDAGTPLLRIGVKGLSVGNAGGSDVAGPWLRITYTFTATSSTHVIQVTPASATTAGQRCWIDAVQVEAGPVATAYDPVDAVASGRFFGYVNEWPVTWESGDAVTLTRVTATDVFKRLGGAVMRSLVEEEMLALDPDLYFTLSEPSGTYYGVNSSGKSASYIYEYLIFGSGGEVKWGEGTGPGTDGLSAPIFKPASATAGRGLQNDHDRPGDGNWVVACWMNTGVNSRGILQLTYSPFSSGDWATTIDTNASGHLQVSSYDYTNSGQPNQFGSFSGQNLANGGTHLIAVQRKNDNTVRAWIDGALHGTTLSQSNTSRSSQYDRLAVGAFIQRALNQPRCFDGTIAHVWYANRSTMPDFGNVWTAGNGQAERTTARFARLCRLLNLNGRILGSTSRQIAANFEGGKTPTTALREAAGVEAGQVYAARADDAVVFECRNWRYDTTPKVVLTRDDIREGSLQWSDDDQYQLNDVTHTPNGGMPMRYVDQASVKRFGWYSDEKTLPWVGEDDAWADARFRVLNGADPEPRIKSFAVVANVRPQHGAVLGLDLSDVVRLSDLPNGSPKSQVDVFVEGYTERITYGLHEITFHTSPASGLQHP